MASITHVGLGIPERSYTQAEIFEAMGHRRLYWDLFNSCGIEKRHLCLDPHEVVKTDPQAQHDNYRRFALALSTKAVANCLEKASLQPRDVDMVVYVSCTGGFESPAMSWEIAAAMGMRDDVVHVPISGAGCAGAGPGLRRAWEHALLWPADRVAVVTCEISNAAWHPDADLGLILGNAIFADGASCYLVGGSYHSDLVMKDFVEFHDYAERHTVAMVWDDARYKLVLPERTAEISTPMALKAVNELLRRNGLRKEQIAHFCIHSGGKSILAQFCAAMDLPTEKLAHSFSTWRQHGNMSSATIGFALESLMRDGLQKGDLVVMVMLGAGFTAQTVLLESHPR